MATRLLGDVDSQLHHNLIEPLLGQHRPQITLLLLLASCSLSRQQSELSFQSISSPEASLFITAQD